MTENDAADTPLAATIYLPDADGKYRLWKTITETETITETGDLVFTAGTTR